MKYNFNILIDKLENLINDYYQKISLKDELDDKFDFDKYFLKKEKYIKYIDDLIIFIENHFDFDFFLETYYGNDLYNVFIGGELVYESRYNIDEEENNILNIKKDFIEIINNFLKKEKELIN